MYFFNLSEQAYLEQTEPVSTLKTMICWKYFFQKLTHFSQENNALDAPASNIDDLTCSNTCVTSIS
jgi:hypothetical protein